MTRHAKVGWIKESGTRTRVHLLGGEAVTLCGREVPSDKEFFDPDDARSQVCKACEKGRNTSNANTAWRERLHAEIAASRGGNTGGA